MRTPGLWGCWFLVIAGLGCTDRGPGERIEELESPIIGGSSVSTSTNPGTVAVYVNDTLRCSGTLIRRQWVLTAKQCVADVLLSPGLISVTRSVNPGVPEPIGASAIDMIIPHETRNLALLRVEVVQWEESPLVNPAALSDRDLPTANMILKNMGYGCNVAGDGGAACTDAGRLRSANLAVSSSDAVAGTINQTGTSLTDMDWGGPGYTMADASARPIPGVAAVNLSRVGSTSTSAAVDSNRRWIKDAAFTLGNMRGGALRQADIALVGGPGWTKIRTLHVDTDDAAPSFFFTSEASATGFTGAAQVGEAKAWSGDFNGSRMADILLLGGEGWLTTPVAWSPTMGDAATDRDNAEVAAMTKEVDAKIGTGDFDGDGWTDIVVMRGSSTVVNLFMARPDLFPGTRFFPQTIDLGPSFGSNLLTGRLLTGDFNGDGLDDIAVVGNSTSTLSTALSKGTFTPTFTNRQTASALGEWANALNASTIVGDWDGDGRDDIAVLGGDGSDDIRVARSTATGFSTQTFPSAQFTGWARTLGVRVVSGDYNGDGRDDIALVGGPGWNTVPIAFSQPTDFVVTNNQTTFASWAQESGVKVVSAHQGSRLPRVSMTVEPMEGGNVVYLQLAPKSGGSSKGQVNLHVTFQNDGTVPTVVDKVQVSFNGGQAVAPSSFNRNIVLPAGSAGSEPFLIGKFEPILIPQSPAPTSVTIQARVQGFDNPLTMTLPLVPHVGPVPGGAWAWPGWGTDLPAGHYWQAIGAQHNPWAGEGFAYDVGVVRFDSGTQSWTHLKAGTNGTQNSHHLIHGVPVRAVADGTVVDTYDGFPENPTPGPVLCTVGNPHAACPIPYQGNAFFIKTGPELVSYAHLQPGSLPPALKTPGTFIAKGTFLGFAGNSGNSSNPHLHFFTARTTTVGGGTLRPMPFRNLWMIDRSLATPPTASSPWSFVLGKGVPEVVSLVRPPGLATVLMATQSSTDFGGSPGRAVDGNLNGNWDGNSVTHTAHQAQPWWKADLGSVRLVAGVDIYNRTDCCADRLSNFVVEVSQDDTSWTTVTNVPGQAQPVTSLPVNLNARYLRIRLSGTNWLSLAEVRIWVQ